MQSLQNLRAFSPAIKTTANYDPFTLTAARPLIPCFAAFSASITAPQCLHTAALAFTLSPHAGQSASCYGTNAHSRSIPSVNAARRCISEISRYECPRAHIVSASLIKFRYQLSRLARAASNSSAVGRAASHTKTPCTSKS